MQNFTFGHSSFLPGPEENSTHGQSPGFSQHAQCWLGCSEPPLEAGYTAKKSSLYARQEEEEEGLPSTSGQTTAGDKRSTNTLRASAVSSVLLVGRPEPHLQGSFRSFTSLPPTDLEFTSSGQEIGPANGVIWKQFPQAAFLPQRCFSLKHLCSELILGKIQKIA